MASSTSPHPRGTMAALTLLLASAYALAEILRSSAGPFLLGGDAWDWLQVLLGIGLYWACFFVLGGIPYLLVQAGVRREFVRALGPLLIPMAMAWAVIGLLHTHTSRTSVLEFTVVAALMVVLLGALLLLGRTGWMSAQFFCLIWTIACGAGIAVLYQASRVFYLEAGRPFLAGGMAAIWVLLSGSAGTVICLLLRRQDVKVRHRLAAALLTAALLPVALCAGRSVAARTQSRFGTQIVFVTCDALRADYCGLYGGSVPTPNLNRLAQKGTKFERFYATAPWTSPSLCSMFSSKFPMSMDPGQPSDQWAEAVGCHGPVMNYWLDDDGRTEIERMTANGVKTAAFTANPIIRQEEWLFRGFSECVGLDHMTPEDRGFLWRMPALHTALGRVCPAILRERPIDTTRVLAQYANLFIRAHRNEKFFLWVHFMDPHDPYDPPARFRTREGDWPVFCPSGGRFGSIDTETMEKVGLSDDQKAYVRSLYEGEIRYVDEAIGRIERVLSATVGDGAYLVASADHGEELWDHGRWGHAHTLYNELLHIPLIVRGPNVRRRPIERPVSGMDIMPTLAGLMGTRLRDTWRGQSLVFDLRGGKRTLPPRPCFSQGTCYNDDPLRSVISEETKLILGLSSGNARLYDLAADPGERTNLAETQPEVVAELQRTLDYWAESFPAFISHFGVEGGDEATEEALGHLKGIGYVR